jgi:putative aldouronate transport system permease protein
MQRAERTVITNKKNRIKNVGAGDLIFVTVIYIILIFLFILVLYPLIFVLSASFSDPDMVGSGQMILWPVGFTLSGYKYVFGYQEIWTGYANTIFYTFVGTAFNLIVTLTCAYSLSRKDLYGRNFVMTLFIVTMYFSGGLIPTYLNYHSFGLVNTRTILIINGLVSAYNIIVCRTFFSTTVPWELQESARIDGCGDFRTFISIVLPLSKPVIVVMALFYAVGHWNNYFSAMIYLQDRSLYPLQLFLREILVKSQIAANASSLETASAEEIEALLKQAKTANLLKYAVIVVSTIPMMAIYPWLQKFFAKGVLIGSIKG